MILKVCAKRLPKGRDERIFESREWWHDSYYDVDKVRKRHEEQHDLMKVDAIKFVRDEEGTLHESKEEIELDLATRGYELYSDLGVLLESFFTPIPQDIYEGNTSKEELEKKRGYVGDDS